MSSTPPRSAPELPVRGAAFERATADELALLDGVGSASVCAKLHSQGIRRTFIKGPKPLQAGQRIVGSAVTLQFMPQREDVFSGMDEEYVERGTALWAVLESIEPADVLVIQAYNSEFTGCIGDMLVRYFRKRGGAGIVVDGRIRDTGKVRELGVPIWCTGSTPHYASQSELFPWAYDVPVAAGGVLVLPGDIVVADDDGAVVVPRDKAATVSQIAKGQESQEQFSRERIEQGGLLRDYYPLSGSVSVQAYEKWLADRQLDQISG
ncbi:regulator of RNase E activity RraA [Saccharothrix ecbatanensis]|uniref:Putative 4-hydroxy-4-methyl-2-oxoglutarate aldolase n=1 Tax=Saccharothrix ecbatanensis TaxID=1105145 RepID=A0A7W9HK85_9PSEU|nr:ribonuclease activity regulator RraA [Saccharothrix ecbatanensis]MBB5803379.1 regulator of RNase E activity RraA [Saccharothrix ecbatanensis]